uniref:Small nuclear RNA activating complex, polypeptide 4 n=1 Tax=Myripristis murdjan TaxID=586833 RepID=A0A667X9V7_9TELE
MLITAFSLSVCLSLSLSPPLSLCLSVCLSLPLCLELVAQMSVKMYLGRFLKPYFKDKLTGLVRQTGRQAGRQKTLLIHAVTRDHLRRLTQPKLSRGKTEEELIGDRYEDHDWDKISNVDFEGTREASDLHLFWQNFLHPSINKSSWSREEVQQLGEISRRHQERDWEAVAQELGTNRTAFMCLQTFQRFVSRSLRHSSWSPEEDTALRELVERMRIGNYIPYTQMSYFMEGRGPDQLMYRWSQVLDPSLRKGAWSKEEDELLLHAVSRHGEKNWWKIRLEVPGRTDGACRDRYLDCLKAGIRKGPFDQQERNLLLLLVRKHGVGRWAKIAAEIPNRFDAQCMREWRKMTRERGGAGEKPRRTATQNQTNKKKRSRRHLEQSSEEEEGGEQVAYMDSDEEKEKKPKEKEEEEEQYVFPPLQEWVPVGNTISLVPQLVALPSPGHAHDRNSVRSTVVDQSEFRVVIGPTPRLLPEGQRFSANAMLMVTPGQLRADMLRQARRIKDKQLTSRRFQKSSYNNLVCEYKLMAAVTPWIGNMMIPAQTRTRQTTRQTAADALRQRAENIQLSSTPIFLLLLQTLNVDMMGCKEVIEKKKKHGMSWRPPVPPYSSPSFSKVINPKTMKGLLQQKAMKEEKAKHLDQQHQVILQELLQIQHTSAANTATATATPTTNTNTAISTASSATTQAAEHRSSPPSGDSQHESSDATSDPIPATSNPIPATSDPISATSDPIPETSNPIPATSDPIPATSDPISDPIPATSDPIPATSDPIPATSDPIPATSGPIPATSGPIPATSNPIPATSDPIPATSNPIPATSDPIPATSNPIPATSNPIPATSDPIPATSNPIPAASTPIPATSLLAPAGLVLTPRPQQLQRPAKLSLGPSPLGVRPALPRPHLPVIMPYKGTIRPDPAVPPPLRREALNFDPSLMFKEPREAVLDWLSGRKGVVVAGLDMALPYLPPFVSSLNTLSTLLCTKKALTRSALHILPQNEEQEEQEEEECVALVRQLVAERFATNPAYQLLKARFLSCFTVPALLATIEPTGRSSEPRPAEEEEEQEEEQEEDLKGRRIRPA